MPSNINKLEGIFDIIPPAEPVTLQWTYFLLLLLLALLMLVGCYLIYRHFYSARGKALRKLTHLAKSLKQVREQDSRFAIQLLTIVRQGLKLQQLNTNTQLPTHLSTHIESWRLFTMHLTVACYGREAVNTKQLSQLLKDARFWLRHWP